MSYYTTQLRWIVETNSAPGQTVTARCKEAAPKIFPADWEFFDETKKLDFEAAFLRHFYMQEICCETVGLWKIFLEDWLYTNMPFYNQKLAAMAKKYDFMDNYDYTESSAGNEKESGNNAESGNDNSNRTRKNERDINVNENGEQTDNGSGHSFNKVYDFPSNVITTITDHITSGNETDTNAQNTTNTQNNRTEGHTENDEESQNGEYNKTGNFNNEKNNTLNITRKGRSGVNPGDMLKSYYDAIQNVYKEIFDAADVLFMGVW